MRYLGSVGSIVGNICTGEFASPAQAYIWDELAAGVVVRWDDGSITHFREPNGLLSADVDPSP